MHESTASYSHLLLQKLLHMKYSELILQGAKLAKTPQQQATVEYYAKGIQTKLANIDRMLTELEKPDPRWEAYKKRNGIK